MANLYLSSGDNLTGLNFGGNVFGAAGNESVTYVAGTTGIIADQNVEQVKLPGTTSSYTFQQSGNQLLVFTGATQVARITLQNDTNGTLLTFANGTVEAKVSAAGMTLGGTTVPSASPSQVVPTTIDGTGVTPGGGALIVNLTTGVDTPGAASPAINTQGTDSAETFNGFVTDAAAGGSTLTAADVIRGAGGVDTLNITVDGNATATTNGADISGIEVVNVRNVGGGAAAINAATTPGATEVNADRGSGTLAITNLGTGAAVGVVGNGSTANGNVTFAYATPSSAVTLNLSGGTKATTTVTNSDAASAVTTATINSNGTTANSIGALELDGDTVANQITALNVNAATNLTATLTADDFATTAELKVAGAAASVNLGANFSGAKIDASGLTAGGLTIGLNANTTSFIGGQGNDVVTTAAIGALPASAINAGAGTADRLVVGATTDVDTAAEAARYAGFEALQVGAAVTADASLFTNSTINAIRVAGNGAAVNGLTAAQALAVTVTGDSTGLTFGVTGASTVGQIDTLKLTVDDGIPTVGTVTVGNITAVGVENLQIVANDKAVIQSLAGSPQLTSVTISGTQDTSVTTGALALNVNTSINASALTGKATIDGSAATAFGLAITGGVNDDTLIGTAQADVIVGGDGKDAITGGAGLDTLTGGAGVDTFIFAAGATGAPSSTVFDTITDYAKGSDVIDYGATAITFVTNATASAGVAAISTQGIATFNAADNTLALQIVAVEAGINAGGVAAAGQSAVFQSGSDSYLFISDGTDGIGANDVLIKLSGVTGITTGTITTGDVVFG